MSKKLQFLYKKDWPKQLLEIPHPPKQLWIKGLLPPKSNKLLCVVGSRKLTNYGKEICRDLIKGLSGYPVSIVSGLALGVDALAHQIALENNLHCIALPGSGVDNIHPKTNSQLAKKILENGGCLISELNPNEKPNKSTFPKRNRVMAGLSHAVLIIEATQKSGTMITAKLATDYNRDVLTVPGSIYSPNTEGPHYLIKNGATPITSPNDLLEALGFDIINKNLFSFESIKDISKEELNLLKILNEPKEREYLYIELGIPVNKVNELISLLEIKGLIKEISGLIMLAK